MGTAAAARKTPASSKRTVKRTRLRVVRTLKKRVKERPAGGKRFETEHFGRPPKAATHLQLRRVAQNGAIEKLLINEGGFEIDKFALARVSSEWVRRSFGAGHYRGNWFAVVDGKWRALGQMQALRLSSSTGTDVRPEARSRPLRTVGFPFAVPAAVAAPADPEEERVVVNMRVRAEREIADMRLRTMAELERIRLDGLREDHTRQVKRLEQRLDELARRQRDEDEDDDEEEEEDRGPPGPWDFLAPFIQGVIPKIQEALPAIMAHLMGAAPPLPAPEAKKG